ncbi:MAG: DMT family transporter [Acidiferrobacter sp.]
MAEKTRPRGSGLFTVTAWPMAWGGTTLLILALAIEPLRVHWTPPFIGALAYNAIPGSALALGLWAYAVDTLPPGLAGMATLLSPLIGVVAAWVQLGERPPLWEGIGMIAIFLALVLTTAQHRREQKSVRATPTPVGRPQVSGRDAAGNRRR